MHALSLLLSAAADSPDAHVVFRAFALLIGTAIAFTAGDIWGARQTKETRSRWVYAARLGVTTACTAPALMGALVFPGQILTWTAAVLT